MATIIKVLTIYIMTALVSTLYEGIYAAVLETRIKEPVGKSASEVFAFFRQPRERNARMDVEGIERKLYRNGENRAVLRMDNERGFIKKDLKNELREPRRMMKDGKEVTRTRDVITKENHHFNDIVVISSVKRNSQSVVNKRAEVRRLNDDECYVVRVALIIDHYVRNIFKTEEELKDYFSLQFVAAQNMMDTLELNMTIRLSGVIAYTNETEPPFFQECFNRTEDMYDRPKVWKQLIEYHHYNRTIPLIVEADAVFFLPSKSIGGISGIAYLGSICEPHSKFALAAFYRYNFLFGAKLIMHELAHMFIIDHDGAYPDCRNSRYLMGKDSLFYNVFSPCSRNAMEDFLKESRSSCIIEKCNRSVTEDN